MSRHLGSLSIALAGLLATVATASPPTGTQIDTTCDRTCLIEIADAYFTALAARDSSRAPMIKNAKLTLKRSGTVPPPVGRGNLQQQQAEREAQAGLAAEAFWKEVTEGPTGFKIFVPDPIAQEVGGIAMIKVGDQSAGMGFRLKVENRLITEVENVVVPISRAAALQNFARPRVAFTTVVPPADRLTRDALLVLAYTTYDSKEQGARPVPLADNCVRHENGMPREATGRTTGPAQLCAQPMTTPEVSYIDSLPLRRARLADPETGMVFTLTFNFPSSARGTFAPFEFAAAHIYKVENKKVRDIEALGFSPEAPTGGARSGRGGLIRAWSDFTR